jgi:hypothetical protein
MFPSTPGDQVRLIEDGIVPAWIANHLHYQLSQHQNMQTEGWRRHAEQEHHERWYH